MLHDTIKQNFLAILKEELIPAMGCTEPIALAYASAKARAVLGCDPDRIVAKCSGNIIKNVRCVRIPNSGGMTGIEAACTLGALAGDAERKMEVLEAVTRDGLKNAVRFLKEKRCTVEYLDSAIPLHFLIELYCGEDFATVEVRYSHTNIVHIARNSDTVFHVEGLVEVTEVADRSNLSIENIVAFANEIELAKILPFTKKQIACNMAIAERGMKGDYGIGIGRAILETYADSTYTKMRAYAAAASEARMDGCDMPVIINSGSGNQGIASTVPVIIYAQENAIPRERLYRALVFSSLLTIYQKEFIGKLSAFCGAVSAGAAAGAAIAYLGGGNLDDVSHTLVNSLAIASGIVCDGAKASCAAKIASAVEAGILGMEMFRQGSQFYGGDGIVSKGVENTIRNVSHLASEGMRKTDSEIIRIMLEKPDCR